VKWTTKYRAPGVAFETDGALYGRYDWRTDGRVMAGTRVLCVTDDRAEASAAVERAEAGEAPSLELVRIERLVAPTWYVLGTDLVVREDEDGVSVRRTGSGEVASFANIAQTIEALPQLAGR
jgi:hypothetical protein